MLDYDDEFNECAWYNEGNLNGENIGFGNSTVEVAFIVLRMTEADFDLALPNQCFRIKTMANERRCSI